MKNTAWLLAGTQLLFATPAFAQSVPADSKTEKPQTKAAEKDVFSTGVAKGRDRLDSDLDQRPAGQRG